MQFPQLMNLEEVGKTRCTPLYQTEFQTTFLSTQNQEKRRRMV